MRRTSVRLGFGTAIVLFAAAAWAQQSTDGPYVLHEFFVNATTPGARGATADGTAEAERPRFGPGQPPSLSLEARPGEPVYTKDGPVADRPVESPFGPLSPFGGANKLDDRTDRVNSLTYFSNFDPSVIPFKRVAVQNHPVRDSSGQYMVELQPGEPSPVATDGEPTARDDIFWGTFLLRLERDRWHPIASVSADQRIVSVASEPEVALEFRRDGADNFYVRSRADGLVRLNLQIAAPQFYFEGALTETTWSAVDAERFVPPLDGSIRAVGQKVAAQLGVSRAEGSPRHVMTKMVEYFRDFDARPFPDSLDRGDLYEAIATNQIGVCRHRSLAFVITAQALGFSARYVNNEAHAFIELYWPGAGWRRIDLGGAADELNAAASGDTSLHDVGPDTLPTPERYLREQGAMERNGWDAPPSMAGADDESGDSRPDGRGDGTSDGAEGEPAGQDSPPEGAAHDGSEVMEMDSAASVESADGAQGELIEAGDEPMFTEPPVDERIDTRFYVPSTSAVVRRGADLTVRGRLVDDRGAPIGMSEVQVYIGAIGATDQSSAQPLGRVFTGPDGRFEATVTIPREHAIGRWSVFLVYPGDEDYKPAIGE